MQHIAKIKPGSAIHKMWRQHSRISGVLDHVAFRWDGTAYASDPRLPLDSNQISTLRARTDQAVEISIMRVVLDDGDVTENEDVITADVTENKTGTSSDDESLEEEDTTDGEDKPPRKRIRL